MTLIVCYADTATATSPNNVSLSFDIPPIGLIFCFCLDYKHSLYCDWWTEDDEYVCLCLEGLYAHGMVGVGF